MSLKVVCISIFEISSVNHFFTGNSVVYCGITGNASIVVGMDIADQEVPPIDNKVV